MKLTFATNNANKVTEIQKLIGSKIIIKSLKESGCTEDLPETQDSLVGNAIQKAQYLYDNYGENCFADDTGLMIEALDGAPGVYTARYAGAACVAEDNMQLVLKNLKGKTNRKAKFQTAIALIIDGEVQTFVGEAKGSISERKLGEKGFGYDPIFIPEGLEVSFAQMSMDEKNAISHRGKAVAQLVDYLSKLAD